MDKDTTIVSLRMPTKLKNKVEKLCKKADMSNSAFMRVAIAESVAQYKARAKEKKGMK